MCPSTVVKTVTCFADTDLPTLVEVRINGIAPVRGHKIISGVLCNTFTTDEVKGLQKYFITCAQDQIPTTAYTYITFQAKGFTSLQIGNVKFN